MQFRKLSLTIALSFTALLTATSCGEPSATGEKIAVPRVEVACTTSDCMLNGSSATHVYVWITPYSCDPNQLTYGTVASWSASGSSICNTSGCSITTSGLWQGDTSTVSTIPSGTYSVCAHIDYDNSFSQGSYSNDTTAQLSNVTITSGSQSIFLNGWVDH